MTTTKRPLARRILPALVAVTVVVAGALVATTQGSDDTSITAVFVDSSPLTAGNEVRLNGSLVGTIHDIKLVDGTSHVTMDINRSILPLHTDATAQIQPVSLLGERFVAIQPGNPTLPTLDNNVIDVKHTSAAVDLDQLLNTLDNPTSTALAALVTTLGQGLQGNGDAVANALRGLAPTLHQVDGVSRLLDQNNALLDDTIVQVQRTVDQLAPPMDSLIDSTTQTLAVTAANRQALSATLAQAPSTLSSAQATLSQLGSTAEHTTGVLRDIRPLTGNLRDVSHELSGFSSEAAPALDSLPDVLDRLNRMLDDARPVVRDLAPLSENLAGASESLYGVGHQLLKHPRGQASQLEHLMSAMADWGLSQRDYDGVSHIFRAQLSFAPTTLAHAGAGLLPAIGNEAPFNPVQKDPRGQPKHPTGTPGLPMMPTIPSLDPQTGPKSPAPPIYYGDKSKSSPTPGSGLTPKQEGDLFDNLVGGGN